MSERLRGGWSIPLKYEERPFRRIAERSGHEDLASSVRVFHPLQMVGTKWRASFDELLDNVVCEEEIHLSSIANLAIGSLAHWFIGWRIEQSMTE